MRLVCLPYAGGSATLFQDWQADVVEAIEIVPAQPPGRRERAAEDPHVGAGSMAQELCDALAPLLDRPLALFGVSMGALVAFECAHRLAAAGVPPQHLFVASYPAPHLPSTRPPVHGRGDADVLAVLAQINGGAATALADGELRQLLLPTIRADFAVTETYVYAQRPALDVPLTMLRGRDDASLSPAAAAAWAAETSRSFQLVELAGGHLFLHDARAALLGVVSARLGYGAQQC